MKQLFRALPAVDACLDALAAELPASREAPRALMRHLVNAFLDRQRRRIQEGGTADPALLPCRVVCQASRTSWPKACARACGPC